MAEHPCPKCGTMTSNADQCDACGVAMVKEIGKKVGREKVRPKGNGKQPGKGKR